MANEVKEIRQLIIKNRTEKAIEQFLELSKRYNYECDEALLAAHHTLSRSKSEWMQGIITREQFNVDNAKVNKNLFELLSDFEVIYDKLVAFEAISSFGKRQYLFLTGLLLLLPMLAALGYGIFQWTQKTSYKHAKYDVYGLDHLEPELFPSILDEHQWEYDAWGKGTTYHSNFESDAVKAARQEIPELDSFLKGLKFESLYGLCSYLMRHEEYEMERRVLASYLTNDKLFRPYSVADVGYLNSYFDFNYLEKVNVLIEHHRFAEAKELVQKCLDRYRIVDFQPSDHANLYTMNVARLLSAYLQHPVQLYSNPEKSARFLKVLARGEFNPEFVDSETLLAVQSHPSFPHLSGLLTFNSGDFFNAKLVFEEYLHTNEVQNNKELKNLTALMIARSIFWDCFHNGYANADRAIQELRAVELNISEFALISDVEYYIKTIQIRG